MFKNTMEENYNVSRENGVVIGPTIKTNFERGLGYFIIEACEQYSQQIYQSCPYENESITFNFFKRNSLNLAANLKHRFNLQKGDVIITCMQNSLQNALPTAAVWYLAGITCSLDPTLAAHDCQHMISIVHPKIIVLDVTSLPTIQTALSNSNIDLKPTLIVNYMENGSKSRNSKYVDLAELIMPNARYFHPVIIEDVNTPAAILFSSGTTGLPKGICLSHKAVYHAGVCFMNFMNYPQSIIYCTTLYWISGLLMFTGSFVNGTQRVALRQFEINFFCNAIKRYKINSTFLATSYLTKLLQAKDRVDDIITLTNISFGGSSAAKEQLQFLQRDFPHVTFNQGYGMTETGGPSCCFTGNHRQALKKYPASSGLPMVGVSVKIVDTDTERTLEPYQKGEIRVKSEFSMLYYYNNTTDDPYDAEKFIKTGDIGYLDENHNLYVCGRCKDIFKYQSWHIVPESIEAIIQEHPAVDEVVVFGLPDGEDVGSLLPSAVIVLKQSFGDTTATMIEAFVAERVDDRQRLRGGVYFVAEMPKTPTGKFQRAKAAEIIKQLKW